MSLGVLEPFKYSILVFSVTVILTVAFYNYSLIPEIGIVLQRFNVLFFAAAGLSCCLAALSFALPYHRFRKGSRNFLSDIVEYVYVDNNGGDSEKLATEMTKLDSKGAKKVKLSDLAAILLLSTILLPFIGELWFLFSIMVLVELLILIILKRKDGVGVDSRGVLDSGVRYLFEFPRTLFTFYAASLFLDPLILFCFMTTSSGLYFIPKFSGAGGLLSVYLIIFSTVLGFGPLQGLFMAFLFRMSGLIFFNAPIYILKRFRYI